MSSCPLRAADAGQALDATLRNLTFMKGAPPPRALLETSACLHMSSSCPAVRSLCAEREGFDLSDRYFNVFHLLLCETAITLSRLTILVFLGNTCTLAKCTCEIVPT